MAAPRTDRAAQQLFMVSSQDRIHAGTTNMAHHNLRSLLLTQLLYTPFGAIIRAVLILPSVNNVPIVSIATLVLPVPDPKTRSPKSSKRLAPNQSHHRTRAVLKNSTGTWMRREGLSSIESEWLKRSHRVMLPYRHRGDYRSDRRRFETEARPKN